MASPIPHQSRPMAEKRRRGPAFQLLAERSWRVQGIMPHTLRLKPRRRVAPAWIAMAVLVVVGMALGACGTSPSTGIGETDAPVTAEVHAPTPTTAALPKTPQAISTSVPYGPDADQFPP